MSTTDTLVKPLVDIAYHANLLALNASVKAIRSEQQETASRAEGVTVLAREVWLLAERLSQAADKLATLLAETPDGDSGRQCADGEVTLFLEKVRTDLELTTQMIRCFPEAPVDMVAELTALRDCFPDLDSV